jgi:AcrR family transcriptional regulator
MTVARPSGIDGRRLRSERTRQLIIDAYLALAREKSTVPTAAQVAERAGYSVRSVFERFPDLQALRAAVADRAIAEASAQSALRDLDADRATRLHSQAAVRGQSCERWLPLWRVLTADQNPSAELQQRVSRIRQLVMMRVEAMFKPELSTLSDPERRQTLIALEAVIAFESWGRMREMFGLSFEEACATWIRAMDALLPRTPAVS